MAIGDPRPGEGGVVDEPDLLEPVEQPSGYLVRDVLAPKPVGELLP
jgi:hypothetical protein